MMLLTWNNLAYYQDLMAGLRRAIREKRLEDFIAETKEGWAKGAIDEGGGAGRAGWGGGNRVAGRATACSITRLVV